MKTVAAFAFILGAAIICPALSGPTAAGHIFDLCNLIEQAKSFDDMVVEVDAELRFSYHDAILVDPRCKAGIVVHFPTDSALKPDLQALVDLRFPSMGGQKRVFGRFRGVLRDNSGQDPKQFFENNIPFLLLELEAVSNLQTK